MSRQEPCRWESRQLSSVMYSSVSSLWYLATRTDPRPTDDCSVRGDTDVALIVGE